MFFLPELHAYQVYPAQPSADSTKPGSRRQRPAQRQRLEDLKPPPDFGTETDLEQPSASSGWFPALPQESFYEFYSVGNTTLSDGIYNLGMPIAQVSGLNPNGLQFGAHHPYKDEQRRILRPFLQEIDDQAELPEQNFWQLGLMYRMPLPLVNSGLRLGAGLLRTNSLLFAVDTRNAYLGLDGSKRSIEELHTLYLREYEINLSAGLQIPIYGAYLGMQSGKSIVGSVYTLNLGINAGYIVGSKATHFVQLMNEKDVLRYRSGTDTVNIFEDIRLQGLQQLRLRLEGGIGWQFNIGPLAMGIEGIVYYPLEQVLQQSSWKQMYAGARFIIGWRRKGL